MTVFENVAFAMRVTGASNRDVRKRVPYILDWSACRTRREVIRKRAFGRRAAAGQPGPALVNNPSMIIADEPTGNIDPAFYEIVELLTEINRRGNHGGQWSPSEHDLVRMFHRRVIEISDGCVVSDTGSQADEAAGLPTS